MGETIVYALKLALAIATGLAFFAAILSLLALINSLTFGNVFTQVLGLVSIYLPFKPKTPFMTLATFMSAVLAFLCARKAFQLLHVTHKDS